MKKPLIQESHRRQFCGEDYQAVSYDIAARLKLDPVRDEDQIAQLQSAPSPDCNCGFCETADWQE